MSAAASPTAGAIRRGEIWRVDFDAAPDGRTRPAVVITADALNRARSTVIVVPLATGPQPHPPIVVATPSANPGCVAVCDQARAVDKGRLMRVDGQLAPPDLKAVEDGLRRVLEL